MSPCPHREGEALPAEDGFGSRAAIVLPSHARGIPEADNVSAAFLEAHSIISLHVVSAAAHSCKSCQVECRIKTAKKLSCEANKTKCSKTRL
jgi:hypothetical protein